MTTPTLQDRAIAASDQGLVSAWYVKIADFIIANPQGRLAQAAAALQASPSWLAIIVKSDGFASYLRIRQAQLLREDDPSALVRSTLDRATTLADIALETLTDRIEKSPQTIPTDLVLSAAEVALRHLSRDQAARLAGGRGGLSNGPVQINVVVGSDVLDRARENIAASSSNAEIVRGALTEIGTD